jgi:hypothetical protein
MVFNKKISLAKGSINLIIFAIQTVAIFAISFGPFIYDGGID